MNVNRFTTAALAWGLTLTCLAAAQPTSDVQESIDAVLIRYAGGDSSHSEVAAAYEKEIISRGQSVVPVLERLFQSNRSGPYRQVIVRLLFQLRGASEHPIDFLETELGKDGSNWGGTHWISYYIERIRRYDEAHARKLAILVVSAGEDWLLLCTELLLLEESGHVEDLVFLDLAIADLETGKRNVVRGLEATNEQRNAVLIGARRARDAIRQRASAKEKGQTRR